jgi:hypothetical protein
VGISIRGRSRRLTVNYRTTQKILAWAVPLLGSVPVTGLDDDVDSLDGYRSPVDGRRPQARGASDRDEELHNLKQQIRTWLDSGIEPHANGVAARTNYLAQQARDDLIAAGIKASKIGAKNGGDRVRVGWHHARHEGPRIRRRRRHWGRRWHGAPDRRGDGRRRR